MFSKTILSLIASAMLFTGSVAAAEPVRIIFETDMGNDVDDVLALDMLYKYQDAGKIQLLLISNNKGNAYSAPFIHLMNDFYGWSGIPVASSPAELLPRQKEKQPSYVEAVAASGVFPASSAETFDSVEKYRQVLAAQPDRSVVIVSVGLLSNLKRLLDSAPDRYSELPGRELVARKVRLLTMMGGSFDGQRRREFNIRIDIPAARAVFGRWSARGKWAGRFSIAARRSTRSAMPHNIRSKWPMPAIFPCPTTANVGTRPPSWQASKSRRNGSGFHPAEKSKWTKRDARNSPPRPTDASGSCRRLPDKEKKPRNIS